MAKRIAQSSINWPALAERVPPAQKNNYFAFKSKSDAYLRRMMAYPAQPPKIDWAFYQKTVPVAGMVDNFRKQYEALTIPFPPDNYTKLVEEQESKVKKSISEFVQSSNANIETLQKEIAVLEALLPYDQMTMEDFRDAHPEQALDPINRPTFWPHEPDDMPGMIGGPDAGKDDAH